MYCSLGQNQFFDDAGAPLSAGRVKIYAKGSDTLLPIYEDNGDGFVPSQNPVITANDGRIPTIFWPAALVDVVVEKSNGDGTYTELDSYVAGLDMSGSAAEAGVATIAELRTVKPSAGMCVNVDGYYRSGDCPSRRYLWVENASNYDDGGYIIASTVDNGGRWVMLWEGERLPASLYGVMCGHSGYERKENIGNLFDVGKSVTVSNLVFIPTPEIIEFDGRLAAGGSDMSPITYGLDGQRLLTIHRIAVAAVNNTLTTSSLCQIHCSGLRGESWTNAEWLIDQNWNTNDQMERISTLWFNGNTSAVHDAFMACAGCSKVKVVELYAGVVYGTLNNNDDFVDKIVIDYALSGNDGPIYTYSSSTLLIPGTGSFYIPKLTAMKIFMDHFKSDVDHISLGYFGGFGSAGMFFGSSKINSTGPFYNDMGATFDSINLGTESDSIGFAIKIGNRARINSDMEFTSHVVNLASAANTSVKAPVYHYAPQLATITDVNLNNNVNLPSDLFSEGDMVVIENRGQGVVNVTYAGNSGNVAVLNQWDACAFIKAASGSWCKMSPS